MQDLKDIHKKLKRVFILSSAAVYMTRYSRIKSLIKFVKVERQIVLITQICNFKNISHIAFGFNALRTFVKRTGRF